VSRVRAILVPAVLIVLALTIQVSVLARLGLPGAAPDLVTVVVVAIALARGPSAGAIAGFGGGLLVDLAPPAAHAAGIWALVGTLVGYAAGSLPWAAPESGPVLELRPSVVAAVGVLSGAATMVAIFVGVVAGQGFPGVATVGEFAATQVAYGAVLAVLVLPTIRPLLRWSGSRAATRVGATGAPLPRPGRA
jgi:rod shape-determining protein MreD